MLKIYSSLHLKDDWFVLIVTGISTLANGLVPVVTSILTGRIFNLLQALGTETYKTKAAFLHELALRSFSISALAACVVPISWVSLSCWMVLGERQGFRLRYSLLSYYFDRSLEWFDCNKNLEGEFVQINRCVEEVRASSAEASAIIVQNIISIVALIATSMYYSWSLTLIMLCTSPLLGILAALFSAKVEKYSTLENLESSNASLVLAWSLEAFQMIRLLNTQSQEQRKYEVLVRSCNSYFNRTCFFSALNASTLRFLTLAMFVQGFWFGNIQVKKGKLDAGDVITCFSSCLLLGSSLSSTLQQIVTVQKGKVAMQKIINFILAEPPTLNDPLEKRSSMITTWSSASSSIGITPAFCEGDISFENISFAYPGRPDDLVLKNVSVVFQEGKTSFIVGKSGSGKSSLINLLVKLYRGNSGSIKVGKYDLESLDDDWIAENVTVVEQKCTLFEGTIRENLALVDENVSDAVINKACQFSLLNSVLADLPDGINTQLGRQGISLSGGQQQRLALARAFIRNTPILVLDEALSALDTMSRELLVEAIRFWRKDKTTIILTHEYTQIKDSDYVYLMSTGSIVEEGYKYELLRNSSSTFCELSHLQETYINNPENTLPKDQPLSKKDLKTLPRFSRISKLFFVDPSFDLRLSSVPRLKRSDGKRGIEHRINPDDIEKMLHSTTAGDFESQDRPKTLSLKAIIEKILHTVPHRKLLLVGLLFSAIAGVCNPFFSYTFSKLLTGVAPQDTKVGSSQYLIKWSTIVLSIAFLDGITTFLKDFILGYCSDNWITQLRIEAFKNISMKPVSWFCHTSNNSSELNSLLMNDLRDLRGLASEFLSAITTIVFVASVGLIWAFVSGWKLSIVCVSLFPAFVLFTGVYGYLLQDYETSYKTEVANLETIVHEIVTKMKTIRLLQLGQHFYTTFETHQEQVQRVCQKRSIAIGFGIAVTNALALVIQSILFYYGIKLVIEGEYSVSRMFETFTLLLFSIMTCVALINQVPEISRGQRAATYIFNLLQDSCYEENIIKVPSNTRYCNDCQRDDSNKIVVTNLSFSYPRCQLQKVFNSLSLFVKTNETLGLVGMSGSGKSTLSLLLTRLYSVPDRCLTIGGKDINNWDITALRKVIAVVEQKPLFFDASLRENLLYGLKRHVGESELTSVLDLVNLSSFVKSLSNSFDTRVHSGLMSGGQAQRLAIARAILRRPEILILDECTSALDSKNALGIAEIIRGVFQNVTVIIITHSEQMMQICDRLLVLNKGKVCEQGSFSELYDKRGELYRMIRSAKI